MSRGRGGGGAAPRCRSFSGAVKEKGDEVLQRLVKADRLAIFHAPVDLHEVPGYDTVIKNPMDLGTCREKLHQGAYKSLDQFEADLNLIWSNCCTFNPPNTIFYKTARELRKLSTKLCTSLRAFLERHAIPDREHSLVGANDGPAAKRRKGFGGTRRGKDGKLMSAAAIAAEDKELADAEVAAAEAAAAVATASAVSNPVRSAAAPPPPPVDNSRPPAPSLSVISHPHMIPRVKLEVKEPLWRELGSRPRPNPCRPLPNATSIRLRDYAASLWTFTKDAGVIAQQIIGELLGVDAFAPLGAAPPPQPVAVGGAKLGAAARTPLDELAEWDPELTALVENVTPNEMDSSAAFGVNAASLRGVLSLNTLGFDTSVVQTLLEQTGAAAAADVAPPPAGAAVAAPAVRGASRAGGAPSSPKRPFEPGAPPPSASKWPLPPSAGGRKAAPQKGGAAAPSSRTSPGAPGASLNSERAPARMGSPAAAASALPPQGGGRGCGAPPLSVSLGRGRPLPPPASSAPKWRAATMGSAAAAATTAPPPSSRPSAREKPSPLLARAPARSPNASPKEFPQKLQPPLRQLSPGSVPPSQGVRRENQGPVAPSAAKTRAPVSAAAGARMPSAATLADDVAPDAMAPPPPASGIRPTKAAGGHEHAYEANLERCINCNTQTTRESLIGGLCAQCAAFFTGNSGAQGSGSGFPLLMYSNSGSGGGAVASDERQVAGGSDHGSLLPDDLLAGMPDDDSLWQF